MSDTTADKADYLSGDVSDKIGVEAPGIYGGRFFAPIDTSGLGSGATITAGYALEQNRELFALPGPADSRFHKGTNRLIQTKSL